MGRCHCRVVKNGSPHSRLIEGQEVPIAISVILEYAAELVCISEPFDFEFDSVGSNDKSLSRFEAREDTPHSVKLEGGVLFVGCAYRSRGVSMGFKCSSLSVGR